MFESYVGIDGISRKTPVIFNEKENELIVFPGRENEFSEFVQKSNDNQLFVDLQQSGCYKFSIENGEIINFGRVS